MLQNIPFFTEFLGFKDILLFYFLFDSFSFITLTYKAVKFRFPLYLEKYTYIVKIMNRWFTNNLFSMLMFIYPKMALDGVETGKGKN